MNIGQYVYLKLSLSYPILYCKMKTGAWQLAQTNSNWKLQLAWVKLSIKYQRCSGSLQDCHQKKIRFDCKLQSALSKTHTIRASTNMYRRFGQCPLSLRATHALTYITLISIFVLHLPILSLCFTRVHVTCTRLSTVRFFYMAYANLPQWAFNIDKGHCPKRLYVLNSWHLKSFLIYILQLLL